MPRDRTHRVPRGEPQRTPSPSPAAADPSRAAFSRQLPTVRRAVLWSGGGVLLWILFCLFIAAASLPLPNVGFLQDLGLMVDAGWRYYQGLRPHADYHSGLGPLFGMIFGLPMRLAGPAYGSLQLLPPAMSALIAAWAWILSRRALTPFSSALTAIALGSIAGGIHHLGFPPESLTFATFYNRVAFGLLGIVALAALLPREASVSASTWFADGSMLAAMLMLLFLKANFFVLSLPLALASCMLHRRARIDFVIAGGVAGVVLLFFLVQIGFRLDRMWSDLLMHARARGSSVNDFFYPWRNVAANHDFLGLMAIQTLLWLPWGDDDRDSWRARALHITLLWGGAALGWTITLMQSHGDGRGISLALTAIAVSTAWLAECGLAGGPGVGAAGGRGRITSVVANATLAMACLLFIVPHASSYLFWNRVSGQVVGQRQFTAEPLRTLFVGPLVNILEPDSVGKINEATALLSRHCRPGDSMQSMDANNLFGLACGLRTPRGSMIMWGMDSSYSAASHPPPSDFDDSEFLLVPKPELKSGRVDTGWQGIYEDYLAKHYSLSEETRFFKLYERRTAAP